MSLTRRDFGKNVLGGIAATSVAGAVGCGSDSAQTGSGGSGGVGAGGSAGAGGAAGGVGGSGGAGTCVLYAEQAAGPFYLDLDSLRRDITEGKPGAALQVVLEVRDEACVALRDLAVDLWHCDAAGVYSGFPGQVGGLDTTGMTFLRGTQVTDANGIVVFDTIYPGWYPGRTTHLHFRVHTSGTTAATSQIYFPESVSASVYDTAPYDVRGQKDTPNAGDGIAVNNPVPLATVVGDAESGLVATLAVTVA